MKYPEFFIIFVIFQTGGIEMLPEHAYEFRTLTWNMQGAGSADGDVSKWTQLGTELMRLLRTRSSIDVVSLQESGGIPNDRRFTLLRRRVNIPEGVIEGMSGIRQSDYVPLEGHAADDGPYLTVHAPSFSSHERTGSGLGNVREFSWTMGSASRPSSASYYIYHYSLNVPGGRENDRNLRTNLAIVSRYRADEVIAFIPNPQLNRPVLGIRIGTALFFSIHAPAYPQNPSANIVMSIENFLRGPEYNCVDSYYLSWIIMGDFNRSPSSQPFPAEEREITRQVVSPDSATHQSGGLLDYAVVGAVHHFNRVLMDAFVILALYSDHAAVRFEPKHD